VTAFGRPLPAADKGRYGHVLLRVSPLLAMTRSYRRLSFAVPAAEPFETEAFIAEAPAARWRLLMFPGTPSRKYLFERVLRLAPEDLEAVLLMRPGFQKGAVRPYPDFKDQIAAAGPFLKDKDVVVLGVSYGGGLALQCALDHPDRVRGVVTAAALVTEPRSWVQPFVDLGGRPVVRNLLPRTLHHSRAEVAGRRPQIGPLFARLKDLKVPVTILHGDVDHLVALKDARTLRSYFAPDADIALDVIKGGSHFLELQFPRRVLAAVKGVILRAEKGAVA
jgi:pimeloyl-ACP methyl ester carboxylesterase